MCYSGAPPSWAAAPPFLLPDTMSSIRSNRIAVCVWCVCEGGRVIYRTAAKNNDYNTVAKVMHTNTEAFDNQGDDEHIQ